MPLPPFLITSQSFIADPLPTAACHASTITETEGGELVAAWFGGTVEGHQDVGIWAARRVGGSWSGAQLVADDEHYPCWNPVLFSPEAGVLWLFYKVGPDCAYWWGMLKRSVDGGRTWSNAERLPDGISGPIKNKPILLPDGQVLCPSSDEIYGWSVHMEETDSAGAGWSRTPPLTDTSQMHAIQPSLLLHGGDRVQALGRTRSGRMFTLWSHDLGRSWGDASLLDIPNPNSGTDAVRLADGRFLLVYNHSATLRTPLVLAESSDGVAWRDVLTLESAPGEYSYPAIIQASDGRVHVTYTWQRTKIKHVEIAVA
ncbi:MAG TPA: sialidase family protein [Capsulimonadaceae bacterium]|jgi:predicted neuraminidase